MSEVRRSRLGSFLRSAKRGARNADQYRSGRARAIDLRDRLSGGGGPEALPAPDVGLEAEETLFMDAPMEYARWYSHGAHYTGAERPSLATGSVLGSALDNAFNRPRGLSAEQPMWRDDQTVRTLVTDRRILCLTDGGWLSFRYDEVAGADPEPAESTLTLEFQNTQPLRLHGDDGAVLCVLAMASLYGPSALHRHPGISALSAD